MEKNYWPDLVHEENTKGIFEFINVLEQQLTAKYNHKLKCAFEEIEYDSHGFASISETVSNFAKITARHEEKGNIEKNKQKVNVNAYKEYKFIIYNEEYFFRIFDVKIGEYFPVQVRPGEELSNIRYEYCEVESLEMFKRKIQYYLNSKTIKDVISYMLSL